MDHWKENFYEEKNNLLSYNRFMLDRFETDVASLVIIFEKVHAFCEFMFRYINEPIYVLFY